jgi:hypothetical protein
MGRVKLKGVEPHVYPNRLEVLAGIYEHLDTVLDLSLKFESRDKLRVPDTMVARLWVQIPFVSCMICDSAAVCRGTAEQIKLGVGRKAKKKRADGRDTAISDSVCNKSY